MLGRLANLEYKEKLAKEIACVEEK
jgi:hypothetical protein